MFKGLHKISETKSAQHAKFGRIFLLMQTFFRSYVQSREFICGNFDV